MRCRVELKVDSDKLEAEIANLSTLLGKVETDCSGTFDIGCKGKAAEYMSAVNEAFLGLEDALKALINVTIAFCRNAEDGFMDLDETTSNLLKVVKAQFEK